MKILFVLITLFSSTFLLANSVEAITTNAKKVILHENGEWEYKKVIQSDNKFNFRKTYWGMSKSDVKKSEKGVIVKDDNILAYNANIAGIDSIIAYIFIENKLVRAKYIFVKNYEDKNNYISNFQTLKKIITNKYNTPIDDESYWNNDMYKSNHDDWGTAIALGHHGYYSSWKSNATDIKLTLSGSNYKFHFTAEYTSLELANLEKATEQTKYQELF